MKRLTYRRAHKLVQLHDELLAALPALRDAMTVQGAADAVWLTVPDNADEAAIATVVAAHVPNPDYGIDPQRRQAAQYLRNTIKPLLPGLINGTGSLTNAQRDRSIAALVLLVENLYRQDT